MKNVSTYIRSIYCPGSAGMMMWLFNTNLTLGFIPWVEKGYAGFNQYDKRKFLSTTIDYGKASGLYQIAMKIIQEKLDGQIQHEIPCNKANLLFEYKPGDNGKMQSYLTIDKNGERITLEFCTDFCYVKENGKMVVKTIHTGLGVFAMTLEGYLKGVGASRHLNKLTEEELGDPQLELPAWA